MSNSAHITDDDIQAFRTLVFDYARQALNEYIADDDCEFQNYLMLSLTPDGLSYAAVDTIRDFFKQSQRLVAIVDVDASCLTFMSSAENEAHSMDLNSAGSFEDFLDFEMMIYARNWYAI